MRVQSVKPRINSACFLTFLAWVLRVFGHISQSKVMILSHDGNELSIIKKCAVESPQ